MAVPYKPSRRRAHTDGRMPVVVVPNRWEARVGPLAVGCPSRQARNGLQSSRSAIACRSHRCLRSALLGPSTAGQRPVPSARSPSPSRTGISALTRGARCSGTADDAPKTRAVVKRQSWVPFCGV